MCPRTTPASCRGSGSAQRQCKRLQTQPLPWSSAESPPLSCPGRALQEEGEALQGRAQAVLPARGLDSSPGLLPSPPPPIQPPSLASQRMGQGTSDTRPLGASAGGDVQLELETLQQHLQVLLLVSEAPGCLKTLPLQQEAPVLRHSQTGRVRCTTQLSQGGQQSPRAALCACRGT